MHGHRGGLTEGPGEPLMTGFRQPLLVQAVSPFMGRGQKAGQRLTRHHPGGDAEVTGAEGDGKRMG